MRLEHTSARLLLSKKKTVSVAESCTGGLLSHRLTNIPGSSGYFKLSIVTYSNASKTALLGVRPALIRQHGAVSGEVAEAMAARIRENSGADFGIALTGIAGPSGGTKTKPVGLVYIAVCTAAEMLCLKCRFQGTRLQIKQQAASQALRLLLEFLECA